MNAVRLYPNVDASRPWGVSNPAPATSLKFDTNVPMPRLSGPGDILIRVKASTVIRDSLSWPETYSKPYKILGNDFSGVVVDLWNNGADSAFKIGDKVYGMTHADRSETWAEYAVVKETETCWKPSSLDWTQAAAVPLTALTAYQALFVKAGLDHPEFATMKEPSVKLQKCNKSILITGATGAVGTYLLQLARLTPVHAAAATRSVESNKTYLEGLGADRVVSYDSFAKGDMSFDIIVDTVGGQILQNCWSVVSETGIIISVHSDTYNFAAEHRALAEARKKPNVKTNWFIVEPSSADLQKLSFALERQFVKAIVAGSMPLKDAAEAYEKCNGSGAGRGKIVLTMDDTAEQAL